MEQFTQRKKSILEKTDKAAKGSWDEKIINICNKLNESNDYYTTSSCSGKSVIMKEKTGKDGSYYLWSSHELVSALEIFQEITKLGSENNLKKSILKFKSEAPILFVCCRNIEKAKELLEKAVSSGFKESGIKITSKLIAVEVRSGEKIEFPFKYDDRIFQEKSFLKIISEEVNRKRISGWKKIKRLIQLIL